VFTHRGSYEAAWNVKRYCRPNGCRKSNWVLCTWWISVWWAFIILRVVFLAKLYVNARCPSVHLSVRYTTVLTLDYWDCFSICPWRASAALKRRIFSPEFINTSWWTSEWDCYKRLRNYPQRLRKLLVTASTTYCQSCISLFICKHTTFTRRRCLISTKLAVFINLLVSRSSRAECKFFSLFPGSYKI